MMDRWEKQSRESSRTEPSGTSPLASQTRGSSCLCGSCRSSFPSPRPGVGTRLDKCLLRGIRLDSASGAKSHTLQRRESRPLGSRGGARKQSPHLQNAGTFRSGPGGCPHLSCTPGGRDGPLPQPSYFEQHLFYSSYLSKSCRVRKGS